MKYFELECIALVKKDIKFQNSFEYISRYISYSISQSSFKNLHSQRGYKFYVFSSFYPPQKDQIYKTNNIYNFTIRSLNEKLIDILLEELRKNINNPYFLITKTTKKVIKQFFINELYTLTPTILTIKDKSIFWTIQKEGDILRLIKQLQNNLEKKYQDFYQKSIKTSHNFIKQLEIKNQKPQSIWINKKIDGKNTSIRFLGNKFKIIPNEDEISQKLAFLALGAGLGEKNSFGGGFCIGK